MKRLVVGVLSILAVAQGANLVALEDRVGVKFPSANVLALDSLGISPPGSELVVLAFDPECVHCQRVAGPWSRWVDRLRTEGVTVIAVTSGKVEPGQAFAEGFGWRLKVLSSVDHLRLRPLTRRSPWLFVFDATGELQYEGHGVHTGPADRVIQEITRSGMDP